MAAWRNWSEQVRCAPAAIERPTSEAELREVIARAAERGQRVRAVGSGHSFNEIACSDGVMLRLDGLARVLDADAATGLVRVEAGIPLHRLGAELDARGLAQENQGDIDRQTLAGALATGTHGTGARFANLSAQVAALRLVTGTGAVVECSAEDEPELFRAARVGLGCVGIVSEVTLRCVPRFTLERVDAPRPLADTLARFDELADGNDHFEFYVFPYADVALTRCTNRVERDPEPPSAAARFLEDVLLENWAIGAVSRLGRRFPAAIPPLNRGVSRLLSGGRRVERIHRLFPSRRNVRFTEMEYAVPREHGVEALTRVLDLVGRRRLAVGFPIEVRVSAGDDAHLSPAHDRDTSYVAVHVYRGMEYEQYFRAVEAIMDDYDGRPHWGKRHYQTAATLADRYPRWDTFQAARARVDPDGVLANEYLDRVLGLAPALAHG